MAEKCHNCDQPIRLMPDPSRGRPAWKTRWMNVDSFICPARPPHVGHIPDSAYGVPGHKERVK